MFFRKRKQKAYNACLLGRKLEEANDTAGALLWEVPSVDALLKSDLARFVHFAAADCGYDGSIESLTANWLHPLMMAAKSKGNDVDNPDWWHAMNGKFAQEYWEAACIEVETLKKMDAWSVVDRMPDMNVLPRSASDFWMALSKSSRLGSVPVGTDKRKESITSKPMLLW